MASLKPVCDHCGRPAVFHISNHFPKRGNVIHHYCSDCVRMLEELPAEKPASRSTPLSTASVFIAIGAFITLLSASADYLQPIDRQGFGVYQTTALIVSAALFLAAAILRTAGILVLSILLGGLTLLADALPLGSDLKHHHQFGAHQIMGSLTGMALMGYGLFIAWRANKKKGTPS